MNIRIFERKPHFATVAPCHVEQSGNTLRVVESPAPRWTPVIVPSAPAVDDSSTVRVHAEVRAKRFGAWSVDDDRYEATVSATSSSPQALIAALADACAAIPEFQGGMGADEHIILQINLSTAR